MAFSVEVRQAGQSESGPATVGWLLADKGAGVLFEPPRRLKSGAVQRRHAKSAASCPSMYSLESRLFEVLCPFDMTLEYTTTDFGDPAVKDALGPMSAVRPAVIEDLIIVSPETEWRHPERPILQIRLPYVFVSDDPVYLCQMPPFQHYQAEPWPGVGLIGRYPINIWPRTLSWAFEWHDIDKPLVLRRGDPLFYVLFETSPQNRSIQLVEAEPTADLMDYLHQIAGVVNYVNQTFSLFKAAEARRPPRLVKPR
ncbi:MAG: hypothetical protein GVY13_13210 [Alphaproteobacteria bacterium]|nr:hypothetical protein [Alphaproteobacteria bacterium]